jgi:uncharacterized protein (DUF1330 family)
MPAYAIFDVHITDPEAYEAYKQLTPSTVATFGGRFIARGGQTEVLEGDWEPGRIVVLEFPDAERARAWWHSEQYSKARAIRQQAAKTRMVIVEGA